MAEILKETVTTHGNNVNPVVNTTTKNTSVKSTSTTSQTVEKIVYYIFGIVEIFLVFRLVLKIAGASLGSAFVDFVYGVSGLFIIPFEGIFRKGFSEGVETTSVFEPSTIVALLVYVVIAWGVARLFRIVSGEQEQKID